MHATKPAPSMLHCVVALGSSTVKVKLAVAEFDGFGGNVFIVIVRPVVSIVQEYDAGVVSVFPTVSIALTSKL